MSTTKEKIAVMQAFEDGKEVELEGSIQWLPANNPNWNWAETNYRVKPEPMVLYVNIYDDGERHTYKNESHAIKMYDHREKGRAAVKFIESI